MMRARLREEREALKVELEAKKQVGRLRPPTWPAFSSRLRIIA
jgi:hypothetical protein